MIPKLNTATTINFLVIVILIYHTSPAGIISSHTSRAIFRAEADMKNAALLVHVQ